MSPTFDEMASTLGLEFRKVGKSVQIIGVCHEDHLKVGRRFTLAIPTCPEESKLLGLCLRLPRWSTEVYVLMPGAVYGGNRFPAFASSYPPLPSPRSPLHPDKTLQITEVPRLLAQPGGSCLRQTSADPSFPAIGFYFPEQNIALWVVTSQECGGELFDFELKENETRSEASLRVTAAPRAPSKAEILVALERCDSVQGLFQMMIPLRTAMTPPSVRREVLPFSAAWEILEEKQNRENWMESGGYYAVGTEPARRNHLSQNWQMGWTGGMITAYALLLDGDRRSQERALRNFDFVFPKGQAKSGFFRSMGDGKRWVGDHFGDPQAPWHLIRKSADGLYFMLSSLLLLRERGEAHRIRIQWEKGIQKCADAFVRLWDANGQFGQFVDVNTGEIIVANSTCGALAPGALVLAARYFPERADAYLRVARESLCEFDLAHIRKGITSGGPGDAAQCPDSESVAGLLESATRLYESTGETEWLDLAQRIAVQMASWVVPYDFIFPPDSTYGQLGMLTTGTVLANAQNKHSAPGICTHSGLGLFRLYRATGNTFFMDLLRDIAHALPQYLSRKDRLIGFKIPYGQADDSAQTWLNPGWMNERVNMTRWGPDEHPGEVFYCSCWPEVSLMLTVAELPGVYARSDTGEIWSLDHITARWCDSSRKALVLENSTAFEAHLRLVVETEQAALQPLSSDYVKTLYSALIPAQSTVMVKVSDFSTFDPESCLKEK